MSISTIVKNVFNTVYDGLRARPVSHGAAATFLATSIYVAHEGLAALLPATLATALTGLFIALAVLQWLALGRKDSCLEAKDFDRADAVIHQAWMFGVIETVLYAAGGLALCARDGMDVWNWQAVGVAAVGAAVFAFANFRVKWVSCDAVRRRGRPTLGGAPMPVQVQDADLLPVIESVPADWGSDQKVIDFVERMRRTGTLEAQEAAALAASPPQRPAAERLRLASKRLRTRHWREQRRAVA
jgi:hypothetical protein